MRLWVYDGPTPHNSGGLPGCPYSQDGWWSLGRNLLQTTAIEQIKKEIFKSSNTISHAVSIRVNGTCVLGSTRVNILVLDLHIVPTLLTASSG